MGKEQGYDVESKALRHYASAADDAAGRIEAIRRRNNGLDLSAGTFGKLAESDSLKADYDTQSEQSVSDLQDVSEALHSIADGVRVTAQAYDANEEEQLRTFGGGS